MLTPIVILVLLFTPLALALILNSTNSRQIIDSSWAGVFGITLVSCFTGMGHFLKTAEMAEMLPASPQSWMAVAVHDWQSSWLAGQIRQNEQKACHPAHFVCIRRPVG